MTTYGLPSRNCSCDLSILYPAAVLLILLIKVPAAGNIVYRSVTAA